MGTEPGEDDKVMVEVGEGEGELVTPVKEESASKPAEAGAADRSEVRLGVGL